MIAYLLSDQIVFLEFVGLGVLCGMGMSFTRVYLQFSPHLSSERVLGQHTSHGVLDDPLGVFAQNLVDSRRSNATGITGMSIVALLFVFVAGEDNFLGVDTDDEIAAINMGCKDRLVLASEELGNLGRYATHRLSVQVDQVPGPFDLV